MPSLQCCCEDPNCEYFTQNDEAFRDLESDVETAAHLGQALLTRHESYVSESEACRNDLSDRIAHLQQLNTSLSIENADIAQDNKQLLVQLEDNNTNVLLADAKIDALTVALTAVKAENIKLNALAARAGELEAQLLEVELVKAALERDVGRSQEDEKHAVDGWNGAEKRLRALEEEMTQVQSAALHEREKHVEIVGRLERTRTAEKELDSPTGRSKGIAAATTRPSPLGKAKTETGTGVVSHFVRDIMEENASLQAGIDELREMLKSSNDEIQSLRDLVTSPNSPAVSPADALPSLSGPPTSLKEEIERCRPKSPPASQEVHVHHHYHRPRPALKKEREKASISRRPSRRRALMPSISNASLGTSAPSWSRTEGEASQPLVEALPLTAPVAKRWSSQSSSTDHSTFSSQPGSPYSHHRASSIFDRIDPGFDSSRPTSPETVDFPSPRSREGNMKSHNRFAHSRSSISISERGGHPERISESPSRDQNIGAKVHQEIPHLRLAPGGSNFLFPQTTNQPVLSPVRPQLLSNAKGMDLAITSPLTDMSDEAYFDRPHLRRSGSQDSLVSVSGMDIHLAQNPKTPLQLLSKSSSASLYRGHFDPLSPPLTSPSRQPLTTIAEINVSSVNIGSSTNRDALSPTTILTGVTNSPAKATNLPQQSKGLGRFVGSWVRGRWGVSPMASTPNLRGQVGGLSTESPFRASGINQAGPILGLRPPPARTPSEVHAKVVDEGALLDALAE